MQTEEGRQAYNADSIGGKIWGKEGVEMMAPELEGTEYAGTAVSMWALS